MKLEIESGGKRWSVGLREGALFYKVGSAPDCEIVIPDASSLHAKIENFMGRWSVTDQMSDTGTKLNGESAYSSELKPGDLIEIGGAKLRVLQGDAAPPPKPKSLVAPSGSVGVLFDAPEGMSFKVDAVMPLVGTPEPAPSQFSTVARVPPAPAKPKLEREVRATQNDAPRSADRTPQELFAEQMAGTSSSRAQPAAFRRSVEPQPAGKAKGTPVVAFVVIGAIMLCVAASIVGAIIDESSSSSSEIEQRQRELEELIGAPEKQGSGGSSSAKTPDKNAPLTSAQEREYRLKLRALNRGSEDVETRLGKLDALVAELEGRRHNLKYDLEDSRRILDGQLLEVMSARCSKDQNDIFDLVQAKNFKAAFQRLWDLQTYAAGSEYRKKLAKTAGITEYVEPKIKEVSGLNLAFISDQMFELEKALERDDYAEALKQAIELADKGSLSTQFVSCLEVEKTRVQKGIELQGKNELPAARPAFDKKKWKLPPAPKTTLMPDGENSRPKLISAQSSRLNRQLSAQALKDAKASLCGRECTVGEFKSARLSLTWRRELTDETGKRYYFDFTVRRQVSELPAATVLSLYENLEQSTRDDYLGMLLYCYDNGLMEHAPRLAWKLWKADASVKDDLDKLMAAKLGIEVPEGGFVERDEKLVLP